MNNFGGFGAHILVVQACLGSHGFTRGARWYQRSAEAREHRAVKLTSFSKRKEYSVANCTGTGASVVGSKLFNGSNNLRLSSHQQYASCHCSVMYDIAAMR